MGQLSWPFIILLLLTIISAVVVVAERNIVRAAVSLGLSFLGVAGLYLLLHAPFLAGAQVLIYVGAITILILFAIMMTAQRLMRPPRRALETWILSGAVATALFGTLAYVIINTRWHEVDRAAQARPDVDYVPVLADSLLQTYLFPFEVASVLLLVALVGAIILAKEERID
ncbi:MAG: NADH-quinone oxidoreductase subunit J [Armatimonadetes bacterium]|nr:NADH-quinone oxidoreductase subunit J [Armatimonadota bacterium]